MKPRRTFLAGVIDKLTELSDPIDKDDSKETLHTKERMASHQKSHQVRMTDYFASNADCTFYLPCLQVTLMLVLMWTKQVPQDAYNRQKRKKENASNRRKTAS
jgi:hypothetical protein